MYSFMDPGHDMNPYPAVGKQKQKGGDTLLPFEFMVAIREGRLFYILTAAA